MKNFSKSLICLLSVWTASSFKAYCQDTTLTLVEKPESEVIGIVPEITPQEVYLSYTLLGFGLIILLILALIILKKEVNVSDAFKYITVILIVVSCLFLITAGYSSTQIAPVIGLLGTIVGYLLGSKDQSKENQSK